MFVQNSWVNVDIMFDVHMANVRIPEAFLLPVLQAFGQERKVLPEPIFLAQVVRAVLTLADEGKYQDAQIWRLYAPFTERCFVATLLHPALPACEVQCEPVTLDLRFPEESHKLLTRKWNSLLSDVLNREELARVQQRIVTLVSSFLGQHTDTRCDCAQMRRG